MAIKITQICDGCGRDRMIRHIKDTRTHQWIEFYDNRYHMCPDCVQAAVNEREKRDIYDG